MVHELYNVGKPYARLPPKTLIEVFYVSIF